MNTMNISLPEPLRKYVDAQIASGRYSSASEYMRELIRLDERRKAQERLEGLLMEGLNSPAEDMTTGDWKELKKRISALKAKRSPR